MEIVINYHHARAKNRAFADLNRVSGAQHGPTQPNAAAED
jgi:hypothetical protein